MGGIEINLEHDRGTKMGDGSYGFLSIELKNCYLTERRLHIISLYIRKLIIQLKIAFIKTSF